MFRYVIKLEYYCTCVCEMAETEMASSGHMGNTGKQRGGQNLSGTSPEGGKKGNVRVKEETYNRDGLYQYKKEKM